MPSFFQRTRSLWLAPTLIFIILLSIHLFYIYYAKALLPSNPSIPMMERLFVITLAGLCVYWLCSRIINQGLNTLKKSELFKNYPKLLILLPLFCLSLKIALFLVLFNALSWLANFSLPTTFLLTKTSSILIICSISYFLFTLVDVGQQLVVQHYTAGKRKSLIARRIETQILILRRVAYIIITVVSIGAVLMLFENVRALGISMLTTAGIVGLALTFTAQKSLASVFSGLEIALAQPIKIGDSVVIEGEFGTIEEINFRNVIVKLWDWRRLIVPTNYFLEKPFENWSRDHQNNLIGAVTLYADFSLPIAPLREELSAILQNSPFWDTNVGKLSVHELLESNMQLKILASADNPENLANLRAEIREKLIQFIVERYPQALPKTRSSTTKVQHS